MKSQREMSKRVNTLKGMHRVVQCLHINEEERDTGEILHK